MHAEMEMRVIHEGSGWNEVACPPTCLTFPPPPRDRALSFVVLLIPSSVLVLSYIIHHHTVQWRPECPQVKRCKSAARERMSVSPTLSLPRYAIMLTRFSVRKGKTRKRRDFLPSIALFLVLTLFQSVLTGNCTSSPYILGSPWNGQADAVGKWRSPH